MRWEAPKTGAGPPYWGWKHSLGHSHTSYTATARLTAPPPPVNASTTNRYRGNASRPDQSQGTLFLAPPPDCDITAAEPPHARASLSARQYKRSAAGPPRLAAAPRGGRPRPESGGRAGGPCAPRPVWPGMTRPGPTWPGMAQHGPAPAAHVARHGPARPGPCGARGPAWSSTARPLRPTWPGMAQHGPARPHVARPCEERPP